VISRMVEVVLGTVGRGFLPAPRRAWVYPPLAGSPPYDGRSQGAYGPLCHETVGFFMRRLVCFLSRVGPQSPWMQITNTRP